MQIHAVTILGANGTMGRNIAAIFASFGSTQVYLVSRSIEKSIAAKEKAYKSVRAESVKEKMIACDYSQLEQCIEKSELVFEACAEEWKVKVDMHSKISEVLKKINDGKDRIICTGTSGLSITKLSELYSEEQRKFFMGMHFFNPPYNMTLCELTPTVYTDRTVFNEMHNTDCIKIVPPLLEEYQSFLSKVGPDYVGTRLHGGIFALQQKCRSIILSIDERARDMNEAYNLGCIERNEINNKLEKNINTKRDSNIKIDTDSINKWKEQFD